MAMQLTDIIRVEFCTSNALKQTNRLLKTRIGCFLFGLLEVYGVFKYVQAVLGIFLTPAFVAGLAWLSYVLWVVEVLVSGRFMLVLHSSNIKSALTPALSRREREPTGGYWRSAAA